MFNTLISATRVAAPVVGRSIVTGARASAPVLAEAGKIAGKVVAQTAQFAVLTYTTVVVTEAAFNAARGTVNFTKNLTKRVVQARRERQAIHQKAAQLDRDIANGTIPTAEKISTIIEAEMAKFEAIKTAWAAKFKAAEQAKAAQKAEADELAIYEAAAMAKMAQCQAQASSNAFAFEAALYA